MKINYINFFFYIYLDEMRIASLRMISTRRINRGARD